MGDMDKERQSKLIKEENPSTDTPASGEANQGKPAKPCRDRSSKFCYQPGELKIIKKQQ